MPLAATSAEAQELFRSAGKAALLAHHDLPLAQAYSLATPVMVSHFMDKGRLAAEKNSKFKD